MSLIQKLVSWQQDTATKNHLEPYMVLQFGTIKEIAKIQPKTTDELLRIKGIGPAKIRQYGDEILRLVRGEGIRVGSQSSKSKSGDLFGEADKVNELAGRVQSPKPKVQSLDKMRIDESTGEIIEKSEDAISVTEFVTMLDTVLRTSFNSVRVQGEIIGFKRNPRGHAYFEIKDRESILRVAVFKNSYELSGIDLEDGMEVIVTGYPNYHKQYGFSFVGNTVELCGEGALKKAYEKLKKKLEKEGLFDEGKKRKLPTLPKKIGLITSRGGAAIGDFTTNIGSYGYKIIFHHSSVEGAGALSDLSKALTTMAEKDIDVLVIVRGGGSLESLQAFNNEAIVRMIAEFPVPVVAGVGHEQDETIATLVADVGVSTPTAAAHAVRESWDRVDKFLSGSEQYILNSFDRTLQKQKSILTQKEYALKNIFDSLLQEVKNIFARFEFVFEKLQNQIIRKKEYLQNSLTKLSFVLDGVISSYNSLLRESSGVLLSFEREIKQKRDSLVFLEKALEQYDPKRQLALGYSITTDKNGKVIRSVKQVEKDDEINVMVSDGEISSKITRLSSIKSNFEKR